MDLLPTIAISVSVVVVAIVVYLSWALWANRRAGASGLVRQRQLRCPKCGETFDYAFVPGASFTSLRLGRSRYMACPRCHRWSTFPLTGDDPPASVGSGPPSR